MPFSRWLGADQLKPTGPFTPTLEAALEATLEELDDLGLLAADEAAEDATEDATDDATDDAVDDLDEELAGADDVDDAIDDLDEELAGADDELDDIIGADDELTVAADLDDELDEIAGAEELVVAALDDELEEVTVAWDEDDALLALPGSILNQLILNPPITALILKLCLPAVKVTVRSTSTQVCQAPVLGTVTVSSTLASLVSFRVNLPPPCRLATR